MKNIMSNHKINIALCLFIIIQIFSSLLAVAATPTEQVGLEYLLRGFNVLKGEELRNDTLTIYNIIKPSAEKELNGLFRVDPVNHRRADVVSGRSIVDWGISSGYSMSASFEAKVDLAKLFKASASTKFSQKLNANYTNSQDSLFYNSTIKNTVNKNYIINPDDVSTRTSIYNALDPAFLDALINAVNIKRDVFDKYGTHYITSYGRGGWIEEAFSVVNIKETIKDSISSNFEIASSLEAGIGASVSGTLGISKEMESYKNNSDYKFGSYSETYGGNKGLLNFDTTNSNVKESSINAWMDSFSSNTACNILTDKNLTLVGIWELLPAGKEDRYNELVSEYSKLSLTQDIAFLNEFLYKTPRSNGGGVVEADSFIGISVTAFAGKGEMPKNVKIIRTAEQLKSIGGQLSKGVYYLLMNDIDLQNEPWQPIDNFQGTLDGNGHVISNLYIPESDNIITAGLFGEVRLLTSSDKVTIKNLGLEKVNIVAKIEKTKNGFTSAGGLIGCCSENSNVEINNCYVSGFITAKNVVSPPHSSHIAAAGGLIGGWCCSTGALKIMNCYTLGNVSATIDTNDYYTLAYSGALVGYISNLSFAATALIWNCYSANSVSAYIRGTSNSIMYAGDLIGKQPGGAAINNCYRDKSKTITTGSLSKNISLLAKQIDAPPQKTTFTGFDFMNVWDYDNNKNNGYPTLRCFKPAFMIVLKNNAPMIYEGDVIERLDDYMTVFFTDRLYYMELTNQMQLKYDMSKIGKTTAQLIYDTVDNRYVCNIDLNVAKREAPTPVKPNLISVADTTGSNDSNGDGKNGGNANDGGTNGAGTNGAGTNGAGAYSGSNIHENQNDGLYIANTPSGNPEIIKSTPGAKNGIVLTAQYSEFGSVGVHFSWAPSNNEFGYRIYRSEEPGGKGISISDFPLTGAEFFDANVESNTQYYYTIAAVKKEADFIVENVRLIPETLGARGEELSIKTGEIISPAETKRGFIMMAIGDPMMLVNEDIVEIDPGRGTAALIMNGRTMLPIRAAVEAMGGAVGWNENEKSVSLSLPQNDIRAYMWIDKKEILINGISNNMDIAPFTSNERTFLPLRFVAEGLGCEVEWIGSKQTVVVVYVLPMAE